MENKEHHTQNPDSLHSQESGKPEQPVRAVVWELFLLFFRMGFTAFGGPAAHIAMFEEEVVRRKRWLTHEQFLDLLGVTNLIPGPNSTEMVIHIGYMRAGIIGMIVAGTAFILPASVIVGVCAWVYVHFGQIPQTEGILLGVKPVVIAIILQALWVLGKKALKTKAQIVLVALCVLLLLLGLGEISLLLIAGTITAFSSAYHKGIKRHLSGLAILVSIVVIFMFAQMAAPLLINGDTYPFTLPSLFLFFFKVGSILYGSGYVLIAFIESSLVTRFQWITELQLLDAVAIGQVTPGPLFTTATFIGYLLAGTAGAAVATLGIFLPSFFFVGISGPLIPKIRKSVIASAFLDGVIVASLALMAVVSLQLGFSILTNITSLLIFHFCLLLLLRYKVNATWLILAGAAGGLVYSLF